MYGYIYKITNTTNNKIYVGQHKSQVDDLGVKYFGSGTALKKAYYKYGKQNFQFNIICWCSTIEELNEKEIFYIKTLKANEPSVGYNITKGGFGGGGPMSTEAKQKISKYNKSVVLINNGTIMKKIKRTDLELYLMDGWVKGPLPYKRSEEFKKRVSNSNKGKIAVRKGDVKTWIKKELLDEYLSQGFSLGWGSEKEKKKYKYFYIYKDGVSKHVSENTVQSYLEDGWTVDRPQKPKKKRPSITETTRQKLRDSHLGHKQSKEAIKKQADSLRGRIKVHKDAEVKLIAKEEVEAYLEDGWVVGGLVGKKTKRSRTVVCFETQQRFNTLADAMRFCGSTGIKRCLKSAPSTTCKGYHWYFEDDIKRKILIHQLMEENK